MPTTLALSTLLAVGSIAAESDPRTGDSTFDVPATCIAPPKPVADTERAAWRELIPDLRIGFDVRPRRHASSRFDAPLAFTDETDATDVSTSQRHRDRTTRRWTISLRWRSSADRVDTLPGPDDLTRRPHLCRNYFEARRRRPADLVEAVDQWTEVARLRALLDYRNSTEEGRDE